MAAEARNLPPAGPRDVVVVGGGTIGAWCAWFLSEAGLSVTLIEADVLGAGASPRAAGMVRAQGGTPAAVRLGQWTQEFYRGQSERLGIDSGFVSTGYYMPCFSEPEVAAAHERIAMQRSLGLDSEWVDADEFDARNPAVAPGLTLGSSFYAADGWLDPPRNVLAYTAALFTSGVDVRERTAFTGLITDGDRVTGVRTSGGEIACGAVVLTGGPGLAAVGAAAGARIWTGAARHQVVVTEAHPDL
ncbi:MAG: FAD-binding oxidoreductase, partial [Nocardioides sp.]